MYFPEQMERESISFTLPAFSAESATEKHLSSHEGEEFIVVHSGHVEIVYGKETVVGTRYGVMRTATGEKGPADMSAADAGALIDYIDQCRDELRYSQLAEYAEQRAKSYPVEA